MGLLSWGQVFARNIRPRLAAKASTSVVMQPLNMWQPLIQPTMQPSSFLQMRFYGYKKGLRKRKHKDIPSRTERTVMDRDVPYVPKIRQPLVYLPRALERWMIVGAYKFKGCRALRKGYAYKYKSDQRRRLRRRIIANPTVHKKLKRLIPCYRSLKNNLFPAPRFTEHQKAIIEHYKSIPPIWSTVDAAKHFSPPESVPKRRRDKKVLEKKRKIR